MLRSAAGAGVQRPPRSLDRGVSVQRLRMILAEYLSILRLNGNKRRQGFLQFIQGGLGILDYGM